VNFVEAKQILLANILAAIGVEMRLWSYLKSKKVNKGAGAHLLIKLGLDGLTAQDRKCS
jgi:hypothetical protein|tara:strand:+ start:4765 stop:4941 length:177 start_codon:yes stop_codon:yes gene_type:complete